jgi:hypothetical protein
VAENQDKAIELRRSFVYQQHIVVTTRRVSGKLAREEKADYQVLPGDKDLVRKLTAIDGQYYKKGHAMSFRGEPVPESDSLDGGLVKGFRDDLLDEKSRDGVGQGMFPLTTKEQTRYKFRLTGQKRVEGRDTYVIEFSPVDSHDRFTGSRLQRAIPARGEECLVSGQLRL